MELGALESIVSFAMTVYEKEQKAKFNAKLLGKLNTIEQGIAKLDKDIKSLSLQISMQEIYSSSDEAEANIDNWYGQTVNKWLANDIPSSHLTSGYLNTSGNHSTVGADIAANCASYLKDINQAITQGYGVSSIKWFDTAVDKMANLSGSDLAKLNKSVLELSYQYFTHLVRLQLHALACLRAINSSELMDHSLLVMNNIAMQGRHCQKVINQYTSQDSFMWFGQFNSNAGSSANIETIFRLSLMKQEQPKTALAGVQFQGPHGNDNQIGPQIAPGVINQAGYMPGAGFIETVASAAPSEQYNMYQNNSGSTTVVFSNDPVVLPAGQVMTGIEMVGSGQGEQTGSGIGARYYQNCLLTLSLRRANVGELGQLRGVGSSVDQTTSATTSVNKYLTANQFSSISLPVSDTPITGMRLCQGGNQVLFSFQTSIHQNAFAAPLIDGAPFAVLKQPRMDACLTYDLQTGVLGLGNPALTKSTQNFVLKLTAAAGGTTHTYGATVIIQYADDFSRGVSGLSADATTSTVGMSASPSEWVIVDPHNVQTSYTPTTADEYVVSGASPVALLHQPSGKFLQAVANAGNAGGFTLQLGGAFAVGNTISDASLVWTFDMKDEAFLGNYRIDAAAAAPQQGWSLVMTIFYQNDPVSTPDVAGAKSHTLITAMGNGKYRLQSGYGENWCLQYVASNNSLCIQPYASDSATQEFNLSYSNNSTLVGINNNEFYLALPVPDSGTSPQAVVPTGTTPVNGFANLVFNKVADSWTAIVQANVPNTTPIVWALGTPSTGMNTQLALAGSVAQQVGFFMVAPGIYIVQSQEDQQVFVKQAPGGWVLADLMPGDPAFLFYLEVDSTDTHKRLESVASPGNYIGLAGNQIKAGSAPLEPVLMVPKTDPRSKIVLSL